MPMILGPSQYAVSKSTFAITIAFYDETNTAVVPVSASWSLTDGEGVTVNSRTSVTISPLAASVTVILSAADIDYSDGPQRVFKVIASYNSTLGAGLPLIDSLRFDIADPLTGRIGV